MDAAPSAPPKASSRFVTLPAAKVKVREKPTTTLYELRVLAGCPLQTVNMPLHSTGRVATFTEYRGNPQQGADGNIIGPRQLGNRQQLSASEVEDVHAFVASHVASTQRGAAGVYAADDPQLRNISEVHPLAKFLSMERIAAETLAAESAPAVSMAG